jgi:hypothetical protein
MVYFMALTVFLSGYTTRLGGSDDMTQEATVRIPTAVKTVDPTDKLSRDPMQKWTFYTGITAGEFFWPSITS